MPDRLVCHFAEVSSRIILQLLSLVECIVKHKIKTYVLVRQMKVTAQYALISWATRCSGPVDARKLIASTIAVADMHQSGTAKREDELSIQGPLHLEYPAHASRFPIEQCDCHL